ncbi:MAG: hypothetical protein ACMUIA_06110 [bacterium]
MITKGKMVLKASNKHAKTIATTWLRSCSGCHMKMFDLQEEFINCQQDLEVNYVTVIGAEDVPEAYLGIIEGASVNKRNEKILEKLRERSEIIIAVGTCACLGDSPSLRSYLLNEYAIRERDEKKPRQDVRLQPKPINQIIPVDYYIPGCPPRFKTIRDVMFSLLKGNKPKDKRPQNVCSECHRSKNKQWSMEKPVSLDRLKLSFDPFYTAIQTHSPNPEMCFLDQGILCMGALTCNGCGARCIEGNIPCWGCMGQLLEGFKSIAGDLSRLPSCLDKAHLEKVNSLISQPLSSDIYDSSVPGELTAKY